MEKQRRGALGEKLACEYLKKKGYRLLEQNARFGRKEVDLIMRDGDMVVFVEVKARSSKNYGLAREAVDGRKQAHIIEAAKYYLMLRDPGAAIRFDVVEIDLTTSAVTHIENAFTG